MFLKGNLTNCIRVFPYAAIQFSSYAQYKKMFLNYYDTTIPKKQFGVLERFICGAFAGITAATLTYPLDLIRYTQYTVYKQTDS